MPPSEWALLQKETLSHLNFLSLQPLDLGPFHGLLLSTTPPPPKVIREMQSQSETKQISLLFAK